MAARPRNGVAGGAGASALALSWRALSLVWVHTRARLAGLGGHRHAQINTQKGVDFQDHTGYINNVHKDKQPLQTEIIMGFTPDTNISDFTTILHLEKTGTLSSCDIEYTIDIGGETMDGSVDLSSDDFEVCVDLDVGDLEHLDVDEVDTILSALCKFHPELMGSRIFGCVPTDTDAIKALMARMDELGEKLNDATVELAAIRRTAKMLATPEQPQPCNK